MITVDANTLAAVAIAQSNEKTRYYLNGVCFEPGVMVATDGNMLTAAQCDYDNPARIILPISKKAQTAAKKRSARAVTWDGEERDGTLQVIGENGEILHVEPVRTIDGEFPDWRRVLPSDYDSETPNISETIMRKLTDTCKVLDARCLRHTNNSRSPCVVRYGSDNTIFTVVMPMRGDVDTSIPAWVNGQTEAQE